MRTVRIFSFLIAAIGSTSLSTVAAAESRSFVASMFYPYSYSRDGDCSKGLNPPTNEQDLVNAAVVAKELGWPQDKIDAMMKTGREASGGQEHAAQVRELLQQRAKINGTVVSSDVNPQAAPDPGLHMVDGKFAYGFNLDDKGADDPKSFTDPATGERGVDNQLFRAFGCFTVFRGDDKMAPGAHEHFWYLIRRSMPAWLVTIDGPDLARDGDVTVTFDVAVEPAEVDAQSHVLAGMTFRATRDPRNHHVFKAVMKDGVVTNIQPGEIYAVWGEQMHMPKLELRNVQFRLNLRPNNTLDGMIGGYMPYVDALIEGFQANGGTDWVGVYWNLRKAADANPDPVSGRNQDISATWKLEAVPAFIINRQSLDQVAKR